MPSKFANPLRARSIVTSTLAALILTVSVPQVAVAASDAGIWRVDAAKSTYNSRYATLTIKRVEGANNTTAGSFIVMSGAGVYRVTGAAASYSTGFKPVDFDNMTKTGKAVLIGTRPRSNDPCGFACSHGLSETTRTVTFRIVNKGEQQIKDMLAFDEPNW
jgi:hypothetical protein